MITCGWGDAGWWIGSGDSEPADSFIAMADRNGPVTALQALADTGNFDRLAGVCVTGLASCRELAAALGLAVLGCRVAIAAPIPILGSAEARALLETRIRASGGDLYLVDQTVEAPELVEWISTE